MKLTGQPIWLRNDHWDQMLAHVAEQAPLEACGLVGGRGRRSMEVFPVENELHSPSRYRLDPKEQVRIFQYLDEGGLDLLAIYHSHPDGPSIPSETDIAEAAYPGVIHLIWSRQHSRWSCRGFRIEQHQAEEVPVNLQAFQD